MLKGKRFLDCTHLFSPNDTKINNTKIFSMIKKMKELYCIICGKYRKFEKPKISYLLEKTLVLSIICSECKNEMKKYLNKKNQLKY